MKFRLRWPDDFHVHVRQGSVLPSMVRHTARWCARALVMPNTMPPIATAEDASRYRADILSAGTSLTPLMTIKILDSTTPDTIRTAAQAGVVAGKLYPRGVTTNSDDGVSMDGFPGKLASTFAAMEEARMILSVHGELPGVFCLYREFYFLPILHVLASMFPRLRIVLENITTAWTIGVVLSLPETVAATITVHHLFLTLDDVIGDVIRPHHFCKPIAKHPTDRAALMDAAVSGNPKFFLGTDSAPHLVGAKECAAGCAGIFTAPVALPLLAQLFDARDVLRKLESFTSRFGAEFYRLPLNEGTIELSPTPWTVPAQYDGIVPFMAREELSWQVA